MIRLDQLVAMNQHYKNYSFDYFLDVQERLGIKNIELWMSMQHFPLNSVKYGDCKKLLKKLQDKNMQIVAATFPSCDFQYQYACQSKSERKKCIQYFKNGIQAAEELGANILTCNSGWAYWNQSFEEGILAAKETISEIAYLAEQKKMIIVMESLTAEESNLIVSKKLLQGFLKEINSPALKVMIDTVAMMQAGETIEEWFHTFGKDIRYMHFVDGGKSWEHLAWGEGHYPLAEMLATIERYGYKGYLSQELITESYLKNPIEADKRNLCSLSKYIF